MHCALDFQKFLKVRSSSPSRTKDLVSLSWNNSIDTRRLHNIRPGDIGAGGDVNIGIGPRLVALGEYLTHPQMLRATFLNGSKCAGTLGRFRLYSNRQPTTFSPLFPEAFRPSRSNSPFQKSFIDVSANRAGYFSDKRWHAALEGEVGAHPGLASLLSDQSTSYSIINNVSYMDTTLGIPRSILGEKDTGDADGDTSMDIDSEMYASSVVKKRRLKMNKHKHRKRRKRDRRRSK